MTDKTNKIGKYTSIGLTILGAAGCYFFGVTESVAVGVVGAVFVFVAVVVAALKG